MLFSQQTSDTYHWDRINTGGGGYMTGLLFHPAVQGLVYVRTDVASPFRLDPGTKTWKYLGDKFSPAYGKDQGGSDGFAIDPTNPNKLFAFLGRPDDFGSNDAGIWKSENKGEDWQLVFSVYTNGNYKPAADVAIRTNGEPIMVDPNNPNYIYAGTTKDGVFKSTTGGGSGSWSAIASIPKDPTNLIGTRCVAIDPNFTMPGTGNSQYIYAHVRGKGLYLSTDGGDNFTLMSGSPATATRMRVAYDGNLYMTTRSGFWRYTPGIGANYASGTWDNISPGSQTGNYLAFDIKSGTTGPLIVVGQASSGGDILRVKDGTADWVLKRTSTQTLVQSNPDDNYQYFRSPASNNISDIRFDPFSNDLWFSDVYMVYKTQDILANVVNAEAMYKGLSNTITIDLSSPPSSPDYNIGTLYTGHPDVEGFRFDDVTKGFTTKYSQIGPNATSIDFCEEYPNVIYVAKTWGFNPKYQGRVLKSDNGISDLPANGEIGLPSSAYTISWPHDNPSTPGTNEAFNKDVGGAKLAVSATDPLNAVYFSGGDVKGTRYTLDGGASWYDCQGLPSGGFLRRVCVNCSEYDFPMPIASDKIDGKIFYAYYDIDNTFYKSVDKGINWTKITQASDDLPAWTGSSPFDPYRLAAAPYVAGTVWIALSNNGLWKSSDFGESFSKVSYFDKCNQIAWGKNKPGNSNPTAYAYGLAGEQWGTYRSTDMGATWELISPADLPGGYPRTMAADRDIYGRVFLGQVTTGVRYGELATPAAPDQLATAPTATGIDVVSSTSLKIKWTDNANNELKYRIFRKKVGDADFTRVGVTGYNQTEYLDENLDPKTKYIYQVKAWNDAGYAASGNVEATTASDMTNLILTPECSKFPAYELRWKVTNQNFFPVNATWELDGDSQTGSFVAKPGDTYFFTNPIAGTNKVKIKWTDDANAAKEAEQTATNAQCDIAVAPTPTNLKATPLSSSKIELVWDNNATNETQYMLERKTASTDFVEIAVLEANVTGFVDASLKAQTEYTYRVRSFNEFGHSLYSAEVAAQTLGRIVKVQNQQGNYYLQTASNSQSANVLKASGFNDKQYWVLEPAANNYFYFKNEKSGFYLTKIASDNVTQESYTGADNQFWKLNNAGDGYYYIQCKDGNKVLDGDGNFNNANVQASANNFFAKMKWIFEDQNQLEVVNLINKQDGENQLAAVDNTSGANVVKSTANGNTLGQWKIAYAKTGYASLQNVSSGLYLTATGTSDDSNVFQATADNSNSQLWLVSGTSVLTFKNKESGLVLDADGYFSGANARVFTENFFDRQKWTKQSIYASATPQNLVGNYASNAISLTWDNAGANAVGYNVYKALVTGGPYTKVNSSIITAPTYADAEITSNTNYFYKVVSVDKFAQESAKSAEVSVTTGALPVKLIKFVASTDLRSVILNWATASEADNKGFEIERSTNGTDFVKIGTVNGNGISQKTINYSFTDLAPEVGTSYYRLKQVDYNGKYEYSGIRAVSFTMEGSTISFYPNPAKEMLNFSKEVKHVAIFSLNGTKILDQNIVASSLLIPDAVVNGVYIIKMILNDGKTISKKVLIEK